MPIIRILGGVHKQKSIQCPQQEGLRPTAHRVRQSAFDILIHRFYKERIGEELPLEGLRLLDVCAGLGGYGFEGLSRGAEYVSFVEQSPILAKHLSTVARSWKSIDRVRVFNHSWPMPLGPGHMPYDVIFLDPPYGKDEATMEIMVRACAPWLVDQGILVVESNRSFDDFSLDLAPRDTLSHSPQEEGLSGIKETKAAMDVSEDRAHNTLACVFYRSMGQKHLSFFQLNPPMVTALCTQKDSLEKEDSFLDGGDKDGE